MLDIRRLSCASECQDETGDLASFAVICGVALKIDTAKLIFAGYAAVLANARCGMDAHKQVLSSEEVTSGLEARSVTGYVRRCGAAGVVLPGWSEQWVAGGPSADGTGP
jgi:hypothetical protein